MKKGLYLFFTFCLFATYTFAQKTIVEDINTAKSGQGDVKVMQDETIQNRIAIHYDSSEDSIEDGQIRSSSTPVKGGGYKIQIFMGNNQQQSKEKLNQSRPR